VVFVEDYFAEGFFVGGAVGVLVVEYSRNLEWSSRGAFRSNH